MSPESPRPPGVVGVLLDGERFLLIRRAEGIPAGGWWTPPSGRIETGETPPEALVREMREELGISVEAINQLWTCPNFDGESELYWWLCRIVSGEITPDPSEVAEVRWCSLPEMRELTPTFPDDVHFFAHVLPNLELGDIGRP